jgi:PAS domain S-box-containing protein
VKGIGSLIPNYAVMFSSIIVTLLLTLLLQPLLQPHIFLFFYIPVIISAWSGGMKYGIMAALLCAIGAKFLLMETRFILVYNVHNIFKLILYILNSTLISWLISELQNTKRHLQLTIQKQQQIESDLRNLAISSQEDALRQRLIVEDTLRQREEEMRLITDIVPAHISYVDSQQYYRFHNKKYNEWFRLEEINGKHLKEVLGESVYQSILPYVETALSGKETSYEAQVPHSDGSNHTTSVTYVPHINQQGKVEGFVALIQDITDRKRAEKDKELLLQWEQAARSQAEAANRTKDEFLATLSHELRTPLNAILGWIQLLRCRNFDQDTTNLALETIDRNSRALAQLIEDVLDVSRIIQGKLCLNIQPVELTTVVESTVNSMSPAANAKEISIEYELDPCIGVVMGDVDRLQQVMWNLLSNAVKFTPKGGKVCIQMERINSYVQIRVSDTGVGIHPDFLPYVFERFRQADGSTTRRHNGLGLGLAIVRHLVELHGGTVDIDSPGVNKGTVLIVNLPMKPVVIKSMNHLIDEKLVPIQKAAPAIPVLTGLKLLVVDDESDARHLLATFLTDYGARVLTAASSKEAMLLLEEYQPDVLISDIGMPEEDGYVLIRRIRSLTEGRGGRIPAIALTAYARLEDRDKALLSGFQLHFPKPINPLDLVLVVANLVGRTDGGSFE